MSVREGVSTWTVNECVIHWCINGTLLNMYIQTCAVGVLWWWLSHLICVHGGESFIIRSPYEGVPLETVYFIDWETWEQWTIHPNGRCEVMLDGSCLYPRIINDSAIETIVHQPWVCHGDRRVTGSSGLIVMEFPKKHVATSGMFFADKDASLCDVYAVEEVPWSLGAMDWGLLYILGIPSCMVYVVVGVCQARRRLLRGVRPSIIR
jgi:hypothetical protein